MIRDFLLTIVLCVAVVTLATPSPALAQSAEVGILKADGSIQLYKNRLQQRFADGTPVVKIEAADVNGFLRLYRWAADGCRGESVILHIGDAEVHDKPIFVFEAHPLDLLTCEDRGCEAEYSGGAYTAKCQEFGPYKCMCVKKNSTGDVVIGIFGDYCKRVYRGTTLSDLSHWVLTQYIRP